MVDCTSIHGWNVARENADRIERMPKAFGCQTTWRDHAERGTFLIHLTASRVDTPTPARGTKDTKTYTHLQVSEPCEDVRVFATRVLKVIFEASDSMVSRLFVFSHSLTQGSIRDRRRLYTSLIAAEGNFAVCSDFEKCNRTLNGNRYSESSDDKSWHRKTTRYYMYRSGVIAADDAFS